MVKIFGYDIRNPFHHISQGVDDIYCRAIIGHESLLKLVSSSKCPQCTNPLRLVGYENTYDFQHYEAAILCDICKSRFIFTEQGLKGEYNFLKS